MSKPETHPRNQNGNTARSIRSATPSTVRDVNRSIVLKLVRLNQPISRVEVSNRSGIFRSSVSAIVDELLQERLLIEEASIPKGRGRVPVQLFLNPEGFRVIGVSIRKFQSRVVSAGLQGSIEQTATFATPQDPDALVKEVGKAIRRIRSERSQDISEVGISLPGLVNAETGEVIMVPALPQYAGFPICSELSELAGAPTVAANDCVAGALAELWLNDTEFAGARDLVLVQVADVGVGTGLILNGEIYSGHNQAWSGEFGHMIVDASGPPCNCGRRGCWELYVSDRATWERYAPGTDLTPERFSELIQMALEGDVKAIRTFRVTAEYLALGLSNLAFGLNPERVVIAGEITKVWGLIHQTLESSYATATVNVRAYPARFGLDVLSSQGSVVLALKRVFASPKLG